MRKRLFLYTLFIVFAGLIVFFAMTVYITSANNLNMAKASVKETTQICADLYGDVTDVDSFVSAGTVRITVIASNGSIIADTQPYDVNSAENHLERSEVQAALKDEPQTTMRYSSTIGTNYIYYALKVPVADDDYVFVRSAVAVEKIDTYLSQSAMLLVLVLLAVALISFLAVRGLTGSVLKPFNSIEEKLKSLAKGEYEPYAADAHYEEVDKILRKIDDVALILHQSINSLNDEKSKLDYIISNIGDGLFAVDEEKTIRLINNTAIDVFGVTPEVVGKSINYLNFGKASGSVTEAIEGATEQDKISLFEISLKGKVYLVTVKRLWETMLTMVILSDVTDNRESAKRREEFFANASHELKTPLTAIKGFNELMTLNNKDESVDKYISGISRETERMLSLIGDMLKLSELENTAGFTPVPVSLAKVVGEVTEALSTSVGEKSLSVNMEGDAVVQAEQKHVYDVVKNLVENAVRYNNPGGRVSITIEKRDNSVSLRVFDNGIGIPPKEQGRIFERFYRVEKSRSQLGGGTGLGLSIVKHICALYGWKLSLKSKVGVGTEVQLIMDSE